MYTNLKSYQIIIALLKKYRIRHCVLSAGSRNIPFVHSVEEDPFFVCYSVVDERSAAYFAMGLSQELNEPVVISCTASTASSNYWPAVGEAFYQGVPLVILTSDRNPSMLHQWEDQMIDQVGMFDRHVRKSVNLPLINGNDDWLYCQRLVNEALLELNHNGTGPVHINIPMKNYSTSFDYKELPDVVQIKRITCQDDDSVWRYYSNRLSSFKRILVICGQSWNASEMLREKMSQFFAKYNCAISVDQMSNVECEGVVHTSVCFDVRYVTSSKFKSFLPDLVISYGYNVFQGLKEMLRKNCGKFEHWSIQPDGSVCDMYLSLTTIFECGAEHFFKYFADMSENQNDKVYYNSICNYVDSVMVPNFSFSQPYVIKQIVEKIPEGSNLHLAINNAIRQSNFFNLKSGVKTYANIGTFGIDGCLSTMLGQATVSPSKLNFLIIGDLSFFYDMNALRIRHIGKNARILMINNEGGAEFYVNGSWQNESSDLHTTARHHTKAEGWVRENNFIYLSAHDKNSFAKALEIFFNPDLNQSVFLEVFTEMKDDSDKVHEFYDYTRPRDMKDEIIKKGKLFVRENLPSSVVEKLKKFS